MNNLLKIVPLFPESEEISPGIGARCILILGRGIFASKALILHQKRFLVQGPFCHKKPLLIYGIYQGHYNRPSVTAVLPEGAACFRISRRRFRYGFQCWLPG